MRAAAILFCVLPLLAQEQVPSNSSPDRSADATVSGLVLRADTGEPLKRAVVALANDERNLRYDTVTDADGRFEIPGVKPGRYYFWAGRDGYVSANYGEKSRRRTPPTVLQSGQHLRDVIFRLQRNAVIIGRVVDEDGEPVADAEVNLTVREPGVIRRLSPRQTAQTNDLGEYRMFRISPGKYYLSVTPPNRFNRAWPGVYDEKEQKSEKKNRQPTYATVFYPGTTDYSQATPVVIRAGDEVRMDFTFTPVQPYRVRGRVLGTSANTKDALVVVLASRSGNGMEQQAARVRPDGTYEIYPVVPGSYRLMVSSDSDFYNPSLQTSAKTSVEVTNSDLENVDVVLKPAIKTEIRGRLVVEGEPSAKLNRFQLSLLPKQDAEDEFVRNIGTGVNADGTFSFQQVPPGTYSIEVNTFAYGANRAYYVRAGRYGNRDIVQSGLTVTEASSPPLDLVLSSATGRVEGLVLDDKNRPAEGATIVAVPVNEFKNLSYWYPDGVTDQNGRFVLSRLRPGEYRLLAFEDPDYRNTIDPAALEKAEDASATAQAQSGATVNVKLKLIPHQDDQQEASE